jgi:hypothetical protein
MKEAAARRAAALRGRLDNKRDAAGRMLAGIMAETAVSAAATGAVDRAAGAAADVAGRFPGADPARIAEAAEGAAALQRQHIIKLLRPAPPAADPAAGSGADGDDDTTVWPGPAMCFSPRQHESSLSLSIDTW